MWSLVTKKIKYEFFFSLITCLTKKFSRCLFYYSRMIFWRIFGTRNLKLYWLSETAVDQCSFGITKSQKYQIWRVRWTVSNVLITFNFSICRKSVDHNYVCKIYLCKWRLLSHGNYFFNLPDCFRDGVSEIKYGVVTIRTGTK